MATHSKMKKMLLLLLFIQVWLIVIRGEPETSTHKLQAELITVFLLLLWPAAYRSSSGVSQSACCVFHVNIVSGDSRQLSLVTSPLRKTLYLTLLTCPYGDFFF